MATYNFDLELLTAVHGRYSVRDLHFTRRDGEHFIEILGWVNLSGTRAVCVASGDMNKYLDREVLLQNYCNMFLLNGPAHTPMLNELCLCLITPKGWYRGIIIGRRNELWLTYCVDIGSVQTVPGSCIRAMPDSQMYPVLSFTCDLSLDGYAAKANFCSNGDRFKANITSNADTAVHRVGIV